MSDERQGVAAPHPGRAANDPADREGPAGPQTGTEPALSGAEGLFAADVVCEAEED